MVAFDSAAAVIDLILTRLNFEASGVAYPLLRRC